MAREENTNSTVIPKVVPVRRIVTGHDEDGAAVVISDENCPHVIPVMGIETFATTELWTTSVPGDNAAEGDPVSKTLRLPPPDGGAVFRIVEFPPDKLYRETLRPDQQLLEGGGGSDQMMHRTRSVDFAIVLSGEIWCVMDKDEVLMHPGDVMVQRGTNHDWQNRTDAQARVAFVLIDAKPLDLP